MYEINQLGYIFILTISLAACGGSDNSTSDNSPQGIGEVTYQLNFNAKWNSTQFPTNFPSNAHFSPVIGATHNDQDTLWSSGEVSTDGIESIAETGNTSLYNTELVQKKTDGNIDNIFSGSNLSSPGNTSLQFKVNPDFPFVSAISMIAPSPDWFIGIRDVNLFVNNEWVDTLTFNLKLYDSGTDTGETFSAADADGGTGIIALVNSDITDTDFEGGIHRTSGKVVGTITLQLVSNGLLSTSE